MKASCKCGQKNSALYSYHVIKYCQILLCEKQPVAGAVQTADRASDTVDAHALDHALSAGHFALCSAVPAAVVQTSSRLCVVALPSCSSPSSMQPAVNVHPTISNTS